jgi:meso-butanediol dehydrogenase / (S,S)-butanediol dehydrogenase / diacetyl reductase
LDDDFCAVPLPIKPALNVAIVDMKDEEMKIVAYEVGKIGRKATTFKADVSKRDDVYAAIDHTEKELNGFDIMITDAGIAQVQPISEVKPEEVNKIFNVNVQGVLWEIASCGQEIQSAQTKGQDHQRRLYRRT